MHILVIVYSSIYTYLYTWPYDKQYIWRCREYMLSSQDDIAHFLMCLYEEDIAKWFWIYV